MITSNGQTKVTDFGIARATRWRRRPDDDANGHGHRHRCIPVARTSAGRSGRCTLGRLLARRRPVRVTHRLPAVHRRIASVGRVQARARGTAAPFGGQSRCPGRAQLDHDEGAREESRQPLLERGGDAGRPRPVHDGDEGPRDPDDGRDDGRAGYRHPGHVADGSLRRGTRPWPRPPLRARSHC